MEYWKDVDGYEGLYQISNKGNVRSNRFGKTRNLKKTINGSGYYSVEFCVKNKRDIRSVHRLVLEAFVENTNNYPVGNHLDGNKLNNTVENLEWCTYSENVKHAYRIGLAQRHKTKQNQPNQIGVIEKNTGKYYFSIRECSRRIGIKRDTIRKSLINNKPVCRGKYIFTYKKGNKMSCVNDIKELIECEKNRQEDEICLIASENYMSKDVMEACGSILINKYSEGYTPDIKTGKSRRYYGGCRIVDAIESCAQNLACTLFNCLYANVQPHSGTQANQAVYLALCKPGDTILGMGLDAGGHLSHGAKVSSSGKLYNAISYGLDENGIINYEDLEEKLYECQPRILIVGASAYSRIIDFEKIRKIVDTYNSLMQNKKDEGGESMNIPHCYFMVDMAHIAGLVATGLHPSPLPWADVVTSTTQKTLRSGRGGLILTNSNTIAKEIEKAVFPGIIGGPLNNMIAGKAIGFAEALSHEFIEYQKQVLKNIKAMEEVFRENDVDMVSGGSDNHLLLLDLRKEGISGKELEDRLSEIGIVVNKNAIKGDRRPKTETSGIRIGTPAITTRGAKEEDCRNIAKIISGVIKGDYVKDNAKQWVKEWCKEHPIYK